ncbi:MAG: glycosyltransferase family 4 protein [Candidatus Amulumruptor caecigallinarius]|nr:glycosyltransferase family 4 protein [Candidatus Amulumruptor caecigallinarius]MCM1396278.1 glycosyltransferase family 4 protein [Candidatus Amulumruptor caecigallinarius]MCM1454272.1 glycosyltransferase family 4 protein [bacterium]
MRILAFHLFNDYSGSPRVLTSALTALHGAGADIELFTSEGGILDEVATLPGVTFHPVKYRFSERGIVTIARLLRAQAVAFGKLLTLPRHDDDVVYVNTILPFGAALAARLSGRRLIYHYHENAYAKGRVYSALAALMQRLAHDIICVSDFQASRIARRRGVIVIPNSVSAALAAQLRPDPEAAFSRRRVLMLSSLKEYKGTRELFELAGMLPDVNFEVVINDSEANIQDWMSRNELISPSNLEVFAQTRDIAEHYSKASIMVSLTKADEFVETFGLTAAEAMTAGLPCIVPVTGGIADLVEDGVNGYRIDVKQLPKIAETIRTILSDKALYLRLAQGALAKAPEFEERCFADSIAEIFSHPTDNE